MRGTNNVPFVAGASDFYIVTEVFADVTSGVLSAGLIGTLLPARIDGMTVFISRAPNVTRVRALTASPNKECTA